MNIAYTGISTQQQNLDRQIAALRVAGCKTIFREKVSDKSAKNWTRLEKAIDALRTEDVQVLVEWDRGTRSMSDGIKIVDGVASRGALVNVLDRPHRDLSTRLGIGLWALLSDLAGDKRRWILNRASEGRKLAQENGLQPEKCARQLAVVWVYHTAQFRGCNAACKP